MGKRDTGTDDPRVRVRPGKQSRPRSKNRPDYSGTPVGRVVAIDRGRYTVQLEGGDAVPDTGSYVQCVKARELGRGAIVIGDRVHLSGDVSGRPGTMARIVQILEREHVLRRSLEEAPEGRGEKIIVAGADLLVIVAASADPQPRTGMVERCLVAAREADVDVLLCMTKSDLADPADFLERFAGFDLLTAVIALGPDGSSDLSAIQSLLADRFSVLVGHSGVGKSTLINALIPEAQRLTGSVNQLTGKGRHTSTSAIALPLPGGGWVVDTPGVRSFGLSHATESDVLRVFPGVFAATEYCLPNCTHRADEPSCALDDWAKFEGPFAGDRTEDRAAERLVRADLVTRARALLPGVGGQGPSH